MKPARMQDLCLRLLQSETEDEVVDVLKVFDLWEDRGAWRAYGDIANNRGIVGNQQSSPVAALVEKLVNSIDAVLTSECHRRRIDPTGPEAPSSMHGAVERFFAVTGGKLANLDAAPRTELAERIQLVACGTKQKPAYIIIDEGEGQTPEAFPDTFLSLLRDNKARIPFVQGKFNMGGTGVLQFAGSHSFQLILSRRQPHLWPSPQEPAPWGFTLIRRLDPGPDQPQTTYVYLAPGGQVPAFNADSLPIRPGRYPQAYEKPLVAGTCIKLWNYKFTGGLKTLATLDLRRALERHLQDPALPIRVVERRPGYRAHYYDTTMSGLLAVLADNDNDIEPGFDTGSPLDVPGVGRIFLRLVVIKDEVSDDKRYPAGVFFNVNGQLHGELGPEFVERRTKLDYIARSTIVMVDCTSLPTRIREDLFLASRDRMRHIQERTFLESAIIDYLVDHPGLKHLNAVRRQNQITSVAEQETENVLQSLVRSDPTLAALFGRGNRIKVPVGPLPEPEPFAGQKFPTYFRLKREPREGVFIKRCPRNRTCQIQFETDAVNDYFSRTTDPGHLESRGVPNLAGGVHLWNGKATVRYSLPPTVNAGDRLSVITLVTDVSRVHPFEARFIIEVEPDAEPQEPGGPPRPPGIVKAGIPNIIEVRQDEWARRGFTELTAVELRHGDDENIDVYINMDNLYLRNEIARRRSTDPDVLRYWFKYGLCLLALGMLYQQRQERNDAQVVEDFGRIAEACRGLAVTVIPVMAQLSQSGAAARV